MTKEYIATVDVVAIGYTYTDMKATGGWVEFALYKVFKGDVEGHIAVDMKTSDYKVQSGTWYLIYATREPRGTYTLSKCSRTAAYTEAFDEMKLLSQHFECIDKSLIRNGACNRIYVPVCGCDGKTYGNLCEARKHGILIYSVGRCNDE